MDEIARAWMQKLLADSPLTGAEWRVGTHYGIHVYAGETPVATFHDKSCAAMVVRIHNAWIRGQTTSLEPTPGATNG